MDAAVKAVREQSKIKNNVWKEPTDSAKKINQQKLTNKKEELARKQAQEL